MISCCCHCLHYPLSEQPLPPCCFPPEVERTYDRSFERFAQCVSAGAGQLKSAYLPGDYRLKMTKAISRTQTTTSKP